MFYFISGQTVNNALSGFTQRPGECLGGDIGAVYGITTATGCAQKCNDFVGCVGFVLAALSSHVTTCNLKTASCADTSPKYGATMYENTKRRKPYVFAAESILSLTRRLFVCIYTMFIYLYGVTSSTFSLSPHRQFSKQCCVTCLH